MADAAIEGAGKASWSDVACKFRAGVARIAASTAARAIQRVTKLMVSRTTGTVGAAVGCDMLKEMGEARASWATAGCSGETVASEG